MLFANRAILKSLSMHKGPGHVRQKSFRTTSPVKILSQFLGVTSNKDPGTPSTQSQGGLKDIPMMPPPIGTLSRSPSGRKAADDGKENGQVTLVGADTSQRPQDPLRPLEETFATYMLALRSRSGNIVGRVLRGRAWADTLAVNELYNVLCECHFLFQRQYTLLIIRSGGSNENSGRSRSPCRRTVYCL